MASSPVRLNGTVREGKLHLDAPGLWRLWLQGLEGKRVVLEAEELRPTRSLKANRYHFAAIVKELQTLWSKGRYVLNLPPYTKYDTHSVLAQALVGTMEGPIPGTILHEPTRGMDDVRFSKFLEDSKELALHEYGILIPGRGEDW